MRRKDVKMDSDLIWFIPSYLGDVRLRADGKRTILVSAQVTVAEREAIARLEVHALKKGWAKSWPSWGASSLPDVVLDAPIGKVAPILAKALKPGRKIVSAIRFEDGKMVEVSEAETTDDGKAAAKEGGPYREEGKIVASAASKIEVPQPPPKPTAATSVAAPRLGCPAPDFAKAEIKARGVLGAFLSPDQIEDFQRYNRFISIGATTGHRYMITSRHARDSLSRYQRTLYDLDQEVALCVHDWDVPAAEEMLALHVCVSLPGYEVYVRHLEG